MESVDQASHLSFIIIIYYYYYYVVDTFILIALSIL